MVVLLYAAICHAQTFVSASEMLEMIQMETYQANQYMKKKAGYKKIKLGDYSTGYYKGMLCRRNVSGNQHFTSVDGATKHQGWSIYRCYRQ